MTPSQRYINITKQINEAGLRGDKSTFNSLRAYRHGFEHCWELINDYPAGYLMRKADEAMVEIYGDVDMCAGVLCHFPQPTKEA